MGATDMADNGLLDFYPTPRPLIAKLLNGIPPAYRLSWLEPSAGKGDICDYIRSGGAASPNADKYRYNRHEADIDVIEINPELQHILRGKTYRLIHDDFLSFNTRKQYDYIVANFPFSAGAEHLQHALNLLERNGGELRCLVNAETLKHPYTRLRQAVLAHLQRRQAQIEYLPGQFEAAERQTSVEVALVRVQVERPKPVSLILESMQTASARNVTDQPPQQLLAADFLKAIVSQFDFECEMGVRLIQEYQAMRPYLRQHIKREGADYSSQSLLQLQVQDREARGSVAANVNDYLRGVRTKFWSALVNDERFTHQYTSNILAELQSKMVELRECDFTAFNIRALQKELSSQIVQGVEASILALFDTFSQAYSYHPDIQNGNIHYFNGWKTNKAHKVNHKLILPLYGVRKRFDARREINYNLADQLRDMVKVFNYLSDNKTDVSWLVGNQIECANKSQRFTLDLRYFKLKLHLKGTAHITFTDQALLDKFNIFAAQRRHWLPPRYGKATYQEMTPEERAVIDGFQGQAAYAKVLENADYYLVDTSTLLLESGLPGVA
jgi:hypothetical protein